MAWEFDPQSDATLTAESPDRAEQAAATRAAARPSDDRTAPYASDPNHLWNRLHRALFVRTESHLYRIESRR